MGKRSSVVKKVGENMSELDKELLLHGTKQDKIDTLTLVIEKRSGNIYNALENLLNFCVGNRKDVIFYVLRNIKDLLINGFVFTEKLLPLKRKFLNILEFNTNDLHIKHKAIRLILKLLEKNILFLELIHIYINKIGDKKEISNVVLVGLKGIYLGVGDKKLILSGLEEFYFRNPKHGGKVIDFINSVRDSETVGLLTKILEDFKSDRGNEELSEKMLCNILIGINGMHASGTPVDLSVRMERGNIKSPILWYNYLLFMYNLKKDGLHKQVLRCIKSLRMVSFKAHQKYLNFLLNYFMEESSVENKVAVLDCLVGSVFFYPKEYLLSVCVLCNILFKEDGAEKYSQVYTLLLLKNHFNPLVRYIIKRVLDRREVEVFDPYDAKCVERLESMVENIDI
jgi:hypothetical protein